MLRNAAGVVGFSFPGKKTITILYSSTLLALREGGWGSNFKEKINRNPTLEWHIKYNILKLSFCMYRPIYIQRVKQL